MIVLTFFASRPSEKLHGYESKLWLDISKAYRKAGNMHLSLNALETAIYLSDEPLYREKAKLLWKSGYKDCGLRILETKYLNKTIQPLVRSASTLYRYEKLTLTYRMLC